MGAYHQMGYHSSSIVREEGLRQFVGAILSPVNATPTDTIKDCAKFKELNKDFDIVFDPQLYVPRTNRGQLPKWTYMPSDLDTSDLSSHAWWINVVDHVTDGVKDFNPNGICSPAPYPRGGIFEDSYFDLLVMVGNDLKDKLEGTEQRALLTAIVGMNDLGRDNRYLQVGSILSKFKGNEIYLVLTDDIKPRLERTDTGGLEGAARLIRVLSNAGYKVLIGFSSSEMILWKVSGAENVASGKFFNLRRFTLDRWDDDASQGGKSLWYWFEPSLLAFLREADIRRYMRDFPISPSHDTNPYSQFILNKLGSPEEQTYLADSWRQFLYWFADCESQLNSSDKVEKVIKLLDESAGNWTMVKGARLMFEEERNTGEWVRSWTIVMNELARRPD